MQMTNEDTKKAAVEVMQRVIDEETEKIMKG